MALCLPSLSGCFTGERPELLSDRTLPPLSDEAASSVIASLGSTPTVPFTVTYTVVTRYGGLEADASLAFDPELGTSVNIAEVRYLTKPDGSTLTCSTITGDCVTGIDETRVSDRQLTSSIFTVSAAERIRQDLKVAVADSTTGPTEIAGRPTACAVIPVVDSSGVRREKSYCSFTEFGVVALLDTADLLITTVEVQTTADPSYFTGG